MINRVVITGRLTKNPELKYTTGKGVAVCTFTLAVNRTFTNGQGERECDYINCIVWRNQAENAANFLKKGSLCGVDGRLQSRSYEGQDGKRVYVTEVVAESVQFLEPKSGQGERNNSSNTNASNSAAERYNRQSEQNSNYSSGNRQDSTKINDDPFANNGETIDISDDDLPF